MNPRTRWVKAGLISEEQAAAIANFERARVRAGFVWAVFGLGILAMGAGFFLLAVSRWDRLSDLTKIGGHALLNLGALGLVWQGVRRGADSSAADWFREGGLGLFLGLNLSFLVLVAITWGIQGESALLLAVWMLVSSPAVLRWGQSIWLAMVWTLGLMVTLAAGLFHLVDRLPEWMGFLALYTSGLLVPIFFLGLGSQVWTSRRAAIGPDVWANVWRHAGVGLFLLGASLSTGLWYVDLGSTIRNMTEGAVAPLGFWFLLVAFFLVALAGALLVSRTASLGQDIERRTDLHIALVSLGVMALPALVFAGEAGLIGALLFLAYWGMVGWLGVSRGSHLLMGLAVWLMAGRTFVLTLEYVGGMFATGLGLVLGGALLLGFLRLAVFLQGRLQRVVTAPTSTP